MPTKKKTASAGLPPSVSAYLSKLGKEGGKARAKKLSAEELRKQAQHAAACRWPKAKQAGFSISQAAAAASGRTAPAKRNRRAAA